jgi:hypothetical protein
MSRGRELGRGNGTARREAYITVSDRCIDYDTEACGSPCEPTKLLALDMRRPFLASKAPAVNGQICLLG